MAGKTSNTILKELLLRYDTWSEGGGTRTSLADPLGWEDEENQWVCLSPLLPRQRLNRSLDSTTAHRRRRMRGSSIPSGACQD